MSHKQRHSILYLIGILAAAIRVWELNARSLWFDEAVEFWTSQSPLTKIPGAVTSSFQPPLYTYLLHFWSKISIYPGGMRLLSVLLSLLTVFGVIALAYRLAGFWGACVAGVVMAFLPAEIKYAQELSEYALMECVLVWLLYWLYESLEKPTLYRLVAWGVSIILCLYSHYGTAIIVLATSLSALSEDVLKKRWKALVERVCILVCCLIAAIPLVSYFLPIQLHNKGGLSPIAFHSVSEEAGRIYNALIDTLAFPITGYPYSSVPRNIVAFPILIILILAIILVPYKNKHDNRVLAWFWVSFFFYYLFSRMGYYANGTPGFRYGLILVPLFVVLISFTIMRLSELKEPINENRKWSYWLFIPGCLSILAILLFSFYSLPNRSLSEMVNPNSAWPETEDMREVVFYWETNRGAFEPTYIYYGAVPAFGYYWQTEKKPIAGLMPASWYISCWRGDALDYCSSQDVFMGQWVRSLPPDGKIQSMMRLMGEYPAKFWIVFSHVYQSEDEQILEKLASEYNIIDQEQFRGASIYLLSRTR